MIYVGPRFYCEAESGEYIDEFAKEVVEFRKNKQNNLIVKFNHIYIEVDNTMTAEDIVSKYMEELE